MHSPKEPRYIKKKRDLDATRRERKKERELLGQEEFNKLQQHNLQGDDIRFVVTVDGKEYDYTYPIHHEQSDFFLYGDVDFLRRSNEIKELLKKPHSEVFGIDVLGKEIRFCDVELYDKKFDIVQLTKKHYHNSCDKENYTEKHSSSSTKSQAILSDYFGKEYDFGYECFDDYMDHRYHFSTLPYLESDKNLTPLVCGVDGCIFKCGDEDQLKEHRELHTKSLPFPCLNPDCKHQCNTRNELKRHMIQHCKTLFPCYQRDCQFIDCVSMSDNLHYLTHRSVANKVRIVKKKRKLCNLCRKLVRNLVYHMKYHPEFCYHCQYPGCNKMCKGISQFQSHRIDHYLRDLLKKQK